MSQFPEMHDSYYPQPQLRTSPLAVISLLTGAFSVVTFCICLFSIPLSLAAVVTGHIARMQIRRDPNFLSGATLALVGLLGGYFGLILTCGFLLTMWMAPSSSSKRSPGAQRLSEIELQIGTDNRGVAQGNTDAAREIAENFSTTMALLDATFFTETDAKIKLSGGNYVTWCELSEGRCVLVVHVPEYRRFDSKAKKVLAELAWETAQQSVGDRLQEGDELAVGLKGVFLFGAVMTGEMGDDEPRTQTTDGADLHSFLMSAEAAETPPPLVLDED